MGHIVHLDFDPHRAEHRRVAAWLAAQTDPAEAVVRLIYAAIEGQRRLTQWEEMATLLANDLRQVRTRISSRVASSSTSSTSSSLQPEEPAEDPESARRLDAMFASPEDVRGG